MKKNLLTLTLFSLLALPIAGFAAVPVENVPNLTGSETMNIIKRFVDWLFTFLVVVAAICIVIAAYFFVTAAGDPEQAKKARMFVLYALIGVLVALLARGLVALIRLVVEQR